MYRNQIGFRHESPKPGLMPQLFKAIKVPNRDFLSRRASRISSNYMYKGAYRDAQMTAQGGQKLTQNGTSAGLRGKTFPTFLTSVE